MRTSYFCPVVSSIFFYLLSSFFPRLISAVADWMSTILLHMVWPWCEFRMHVWNVLHAAHWKYRMHKWQKIAVWDHRTTLSGYIFTTKACINNQKKLVKQQYLLQMSPQYDELQPTNGWDLLASLGDPRKFKRVSCLGSISAWHSSSRCQPKFAELNRGRHLYLAGRPSRWALAHILVLHKSLFCVSV